MEARKFYDVDGRNIKFRNFEGKAGKYNAEGDRNFCLLLDPDTADNMLAEGYNVRFLKPRDDNDEPVPYIQIKVNYGKGRPPKITQVTSRGKVELDENTVRNLDWAEIESACISINPYNWRLPDGRTGMKAYLKTMIVKIVDDDFEDRYYDVPDSAQNITE